MGKVFTLRHMGNDIEIAIPNYNENGSFFPGTGQVNITYTGTMWEEVLNDWNTTPISNQFVLIPGASAGGSTGEACMNDFATRMNQAWKAGFTYIYSGFNDKRLDLLNATAKFVNPENGRYFKWEEAVGNTVKAVVYDSNDNALFTSTNISYKYNEYNLGDIANFIAWTNFSNFCSANTWADAKQYCHTLTWNMSFDGAGGSLICAFHKDQMLDVIGQMFWYLFGNVDPSHDDDDPGGDDDDPYDPYNPSPPYDPDDAGGQDPYDDGDDVPVPDLPDMGLCDSGLLALYTPSLTQMNLLGAYLWSQNFVDSLVKSVYANPIDVIIDIGLYPFNITPAGTKEIIVGNRGSGVSSAYPASEWYRFDCGTVDVKSVLKSCLDYMPYTKGYIYIPFCGIVPLDIDFVMDKTVGLKYNINLLTGQAVAYLTANGKVFQEYTCNLKSSIPLSQNNASRMWQSFLNITVPVLVGGAAGAASQLTGAAAMSNVNAGAAQTAEELAGMSNSALDISKGAYNTGASNAGNSASNIMSGMATKPSIEKSNSMGITGGFVGCKQKPCIIIERANHVRAENQNMYSGYPAFMTKRLDNVKGYTEVAYSRLSIPSATQNECTMIRDIIHAGFIINRAPVIPNGDLVLMKNKSPVNQVGKDLETIATITGQFRHEVNISHLTVRIERNDPLGFNYIYCSKTGRFYFVEDVKIVRTGILDVICSVDVLESFGSELLQNVVIVSKNEKEYNLLLNDGTLKTQQNPLISMWNFPTGFGTDYEFVLVVAGNQSGGN